MQKESLINQSLLEKRSDILILNGTLVDDPGLLHGKMGIAIFLSHYAKHTGNAIYEDYVLDLILEIQKQIHLNSPVDYEYGLAGIGVALDYLIQNDFFEADEDLFEDLDEKMYRTVMYEPYSNFSLYHGIAGYGKYWKCRDISVNGKAETVLLHLLNVIQKEIDKIDEIEQLDVFCFLSDLSKISQYSSLAHDLINKCSNWSCIQNPDKIFLRLEKSKISDITNLYLNHIYFNKPLDKNFYELLPQVEETHEESDMGILNGYAGQGLRLLSQLKSDISWINLL